MTAPSGGSRPADGARSPMSPVLERPEAAQGGARPEPRSLAEIFPQGTSVDRGRSPPEIAYAIGELVHNYFRTRGVTLASYELRRLVAELLAQHGPVKEGEELVSFASARAKAPWAGDEPPT